MSACYECCIHHQVLLVCDCVLFVAGFGGDGVQTSKCFRTSSFVGLCAIFQASTITRTVLALRVWYCTC